MNHLHTGSAGARGDAAAIVAGVVADHLAELARQWPIGLRVEHTDSGWLGTVTVDDARYAPGITVGDQPAHCLLFAPPYGPDVPAVVCVAWDRPEAREVAWIRAERLKPAGSGGEQGPGQASEHPRMGGRRRIRRRAEAASR